MTLREDGTLDQGEQELLNFWGEFCQDRHAASFMSPTMELVDEFARWLGKQWGTEEAQHQMQQAARVWWQRRDLGLFSWERDLLESWARFSFELRSTDFVRPGPNASYEFGTWLANREPESHTRIEELDLSVGAFNLLRARDVRFVRPRPSR